MKIAKVLADRLRAHGEKDFPAEAVGILAGNRQTQEVLRTLPLQNQRDHTKNRYQVDALSQWQAESALETEGLDILGYYHSHPNHPSVYSAYDQAHALPNMNYVIISVLNGKAATIQNWFLREDRSAMHEQPFIET